MSRIVNKWKSVVGMGNAVETQKGEMATFFPGSRDVVLKRQSLTQELGPEGCAFLARGGVGGHSGGSEARGLAAEEHVCLQDRPPVNPESHCSDPAY